METKKIGLEGPFVSKLPTIKDFDKKKLIDESKDAFNRARRIQILQLPLGTMAEVAKIFNINIVC